MPPPLDTMKMKKMTMCVFRPLLVGAQQRADQEHRGAGRADEARQDGADAEEAVLTIGVPASEPFR
jgi:hypothetical protein